MVNSSATCYRGQRPGRALVPSSEHFHPPERMAMLVFPWRGLAWGGVAWQRRGPEGEHLAQARGRLWEAS